MSASIKMVKAKPVTCVGQTVMGESTAVWIVDGFDVFESKSV